MAADTPCKEKPWRCNPRDVKLVAFDADQTAWDIFPSIIATNICGPFTKVDDDTVEGLGCRARGQ